MASFKYDVFPEDLSSDYYNHYMSIMAYISGNPEYAAGMFIPGGGGGGPGIVYTDKHIYTEIKLGNLATNAIGAAANQLGVPLTGGAIRAGASFAGKPITPQVEVLYTSTNTRSFQFTFLMAPASPKESEYMYSIVKNLRKYAAPKRLDGLSGLGGLIYDYPAEFEIKFYHGNKENTSIPRIRKCVLTDVEANYTPSGEWSTFLDGTPVACMLSLNFQELEIINRNLIEQGF